MLPSSQKLNSILSARLNLGTQKLIAVLRRLTDVSNKEIKAAKPAMETPGECLKLSSEFAEFSDKDERIRGNLCYERIDKSKYPTITNS